MRHGSTSRVLEQHFHRSQKLYESLLAAILGYIVNPEMLTPPSQADIIIALGRRERRFERLLRLTALLVDKHFD